MRNEVGKEYQLEEPKKTKNLPLTTIGRRKPTKISPERCSTRRRRQRTERSRSDFKWTVLRRKEKENVKKKKAKYVWCVCVCTTMHERNKEVMNIYMEKENLGLMAQQEKLQNYPLMFSIFIEEYTSFYYYFFFFIGHRIILIQFKL